MQTSKIQWQQACVCVAYCVPVHEAPHCCSHFTRKEDHQKEEELRKENKDDQSFIQSVLNELIKTKKIKRNGWMLDEGNPGTKKQEKQQQGRKY